MKSFLKKSALVLCGLLLSIIIIGQFFPQTERTAASPVVAEKVLVPGGQSVGVKMDVRGVLIVGPVSYTHLDVYKRQGQGSFRPRLGGYIRSIKRLM